MSRELFDARQPARSEEQLALLPPSRRSLSSASPVAAPQGRADRELSKRPESKGSPYLALQAATEPHFGYATTKRVLEFLIALALLVALAPLMLAAAALILLTSGRPVLFGQRRMGLLGAEFTCWKFRTMTPDAEARRDEVAHLNTTAGPTFKCPNDPRVTRVGKFLRKSSIDELPQLWNVLRGEMALVGPRPLPLAENRYHGDQILRLTVKPGLTCTWQVNGRSNIGFDEWMALDLAYIRDRSVRGDIALMLRTVGAVLLHNGAE